MANPITISQRHLGNSIIFGFAMICAIITVLMLLGDTLAWPRWWIVIVSGISTLLIELSILNLWTSRSTRWSHVWSTNNPVIRLAIVLILLINLIVLTGLNYVSWTISERQEHKNQHDIMTTAIALSELVSTVDPADPYGQLDQAASFILPDRVAEFRKKITSIIEDKVNNHVAVQAHVISAGIETLQKTQALTTVILASQQISLTTHQNRQIITPIRVSLIKKNTRWYVSDLGSMYQTH